MGAAFRFALIRRLSAPDAEFHIQIGFVDLP
jgi:hypothetical protein